ncbi:MAG: hypothetical protein V1744_05185 [Candidatus Altiarchaeota archaeon]
MFKGLWLGLKSAIIASSCCSLPLALVLVFSALGSGSMTAALKIPRYKMFFAAAGTLFLLSSLYMTVKRNSGGTCRICDVKKEKSLIAVSLVSYAVLTALLIYVVLPAVSELLFA